MKITEASIHSLVADPRNSNKGTARGREALRQSLERFGAGRSILTARDRTILAGNKTWETAVEGGFEDVIEVETDGTKLVVVRRTDLDPDSPEARELALADNRVGELDLEIEPLRIQEMLNDGLDLSWLYERDELEELLGDLGASGGFVPGVDPDAIPQEVESRCNLGDLWSLGRHRLLCGDSTQPEQVARLLDGEALDMILTDPPYCSGGFQETGKSSKRSGSIGTRRRELIANDTLSTRGYQSLIRTVLGCWSAGVVYTFVDWRMWVNLFDVVEGAGYGVRNMIVWDKGTPGMGNGWRMQHELIMCGVRVANPFEPKKSRGNVIQSARTGNPLHETQKPVDLVAAIIDVTDHARTVGDPFAGAGTTLMAAEETGRTAFLCELDPHYTSTCVQRWESVTGQQAVRL